MAALFDADQHGDMLNMLGAAAGIDPDNLPERMDGINNLLNQMPPPVRDKLLADFLNRLYTSR